MAGGIRHAGLMLDVHSRATHASTRTDPRREQVVAMLRNRFAALKLATLRIDRIALFRQDDAMARFRIIGHWSLRGRDG